MRAELGASRCIARGPAWPSPTRGEFNSYKRPPQGGPETLGHQHGVLQTSIAQKPPAEGKLRYSLAEESLVPLGSVDEDPEERGLSNHGWL